MEIRIKTTYTPRHLNYTFSPSRFGKWTKWWESRWVSNWRASADFRLWYKSTLRNESTSVLTPALELNWPSLIKTSSAELGPQTCLFLIADIFVKGTNTQRDAIAAMFRRCKIREFPAVDQFLGIIMKVQHQNDFTARASLLSVLGALCDHVRGKRQVANLIRRSLDSRDGEEQSAAVWASERLGIFWI